MLSTGFYVSLLMTQTMDVKRKDSKQMCLHHLATLAALIFSWANNMIRMGTLVLLLHDIADPFLEVGFNYCKINIGNDRMATFTTSYVCFFRLRKFVVT